MQHIRFPWKNNFSQSFYFFKVPVFLKFQFLWSLSFFGDEIFFMIFFFFCGIFFSFEFLFSLQNFFLIFCSFLIKIFIFFQKKKIIENCFYRKNIFIKKKLVLKKKFVSTKKIFIEKNECIEKKFFSLKENYPFIISLKISSSLLYSSSKFFTKFFYKVIFHNSHVLGYCSILWSWWLLWLIWHHQNSSSI